MSAIFKAIIIDDENKAITNLKIIINEFATNIEVVGSANSAKDGLTLIETAEPDIVFLDIQMPNMSGIELLEVYKGERNFEVIFLTAFNNYANEAFKLNAFFYLLKPIHIPDFLAVVNKLTQKNEKTHNREHADRLKEFFTNHLSIATTQGTEFVKISEILRIEASGSYTIIYMLNKRTFMLSKNLKSIEDILIRHSFFRTHKSHLINVNYIQKYFTYKDGGIIVMTDGSEIELSRACKEKFTALYKL